MFQKCSHALVLTTPLLTSDHANTLVQRELLDDQPVRNYVGFLRDFSLILVRRAMLIVIFVLEACDVPLGGVLPGPTELLCAELCQLLQEQLIEDPHERCAYDRPSACRLDSEAARNSFQGADFRRLVPVTWSTRLYALIASGLIQLLKDHDLEVRLTTARAISCLHAFA